MDMVRFGRGIRALRHRRGWRQADLANEADVSRSVVARIEAGQGDRVPGRTLERVARPLGARVKTWLDWNGEALDRLLDGAHAALAEAVVAFLRRWGWEVAVEVTFAIRGERGSIDILAWHAATQVLLVIEVKSVVPDLQAMFLSFDRKVRLGAEIARDRGWRPRSIVKVLVIGETRTNRRRVEAHAAIFGVELPDRTVAVKRFLAVPNVEQRLRGLWFVSTARVASARHRVRNPRAAA
jgi:transcriptional regulator with XRE-family HTH domain